MTQPHHPRGLSRRTFIRTAAIAGASLAVGPVTACNAVPSVGGGTTRAPRIGEPRWSDPSTWTGRMPSEDDVAVIARTVVLDRDVRLAGLLIRPGGELVFDPDRSRTLDSSSNIVVEGSLVMQPATPRTVHRIVFRGVDENAFVGGGMDVLDSDVGLWVMGRGKLRLKGSKRRAWTRAVGTVPSGTREITLEDDPKGWREGDELAIAPTRSPSANFDEAFDYAKVGSISGRTIELTTATRFDHPSLTVGSRAFGAEVLDLTRNVQIEGTPGGRSHVFIHSSRAQSIRWAAIRHMGPRQRAEEFTESVLGRYGLHFHLCGDGSRRSIVKETVVRDCGGHAFVPHTSHGVSFIDCISHDTFDEGYWWDDAPDTRTPGARTDDVLYSKCVASLVRSDPPFRGYRLAGFHLGRGRGSAARGCVAVGVRGNENAAGFIWPEGSEGIWDFEDCVAHNNSVNGIFIWQNTDRHHVIERFVAFHNGRAGIEHGAYLNSYVYRNVDLVGNSLAGVILHAESDHQGSLRFENVKVDGRAITNFGFLGAEPILNGAPAIVCSPSITDVSESDFALDYSGDSLDDRFDVRESC